VQVARNVTRAVGWLFVIVIGYHAVLAVGEAHHAASAGHWTHAAELAAIALVAAAVVVVAVASALRSVRARR
jgi:hypothetical protein